MASRSEIVDYISSALKIGEFKDSSLNGLQIEGTNEIKKIAVAVDAGRTVIESAIASGAQMLVVHHGIFWGAQEPLIGTFREFVERVLNAQLNLVAVHLPLDAHEQYGNNFCLGRLLGLSDLRPWGYHEGQHIGCMGINRAKKRLPELIAPLLGLPGAAAEIQRLAFGPAVPEDVAILSGAGADFLRSYKDGFDTLITGEPRQFAFHFAKDNGLNAVFAGHYASETIGVTELGKHLAAKFKLEFEFIDAPTGI